MPAKRDIPPPLPIFAPKQRRKGRTEAAADRALRAAALPPAAAALAAAIRVQAQQIDELAAGGASIAYACSVYLQLLTAAGMTAAPTPPINPHRDDDDADTVADLLRLGRATHRDPDTDTG